MNEVRLTSVRFPKPNRLEVRLARRGSLARALGPRFWCEYDVPIDTVPESWIFSTLERSEPSC